MNPQDLRDDAADLGGCVELALAFSTLGREVPHQVFIGVPQDVVAFSAVLREVKSRVLEDGDEVGELVDFLLSVAELCRVVEVRKVRELVGVCQRGDDLLVDLVADVALPLESDHVFEAGPFGDGNWRVGLAGVFVADVLDEQQDEDVILVLAGIHAAAQFIAARPEGGIEFGFLDGHWWSIRIGLRNKNPQGGLLTHFPCGSDVHSVEWKTAQMSNVSKRRKKEGTNQCGGSFWLEIPAGQICVERATVLRCWRKSQGFLQQRGTIPSSDPSEEHGPPDQIGSTRTVYLL
jgi:hypothetical protein